MFHACCWLEAGVCTASQEKDFLVPQVVGQPTVRLINVLLVLLEYLVDERPATIHGELGMRKGLIAAEKEHMLAHEGHKVL